jgi:ribose transport system permease protein
VSDVAQKEPAGTGTGPDPVHERQRGGFLSTPAGRHTGLAAALIIMILIGALTVPDRFLAVSNLRVVLSLAAVIGVLSIGQTFVVIGAGIDLSIGSLVALCSVFATVQFTQDMAASSSWWVMVLMAVVIGTVAGLVNGLLIAYGPIVPFIMTLATMAAFKGLAEVVSAKKTLVVRDNSFKDFFNGSLAGIPTQVIVFALVALVAWVILNRTTFGRRTYAVGGNPEAARLAGINVNRHTVLLYVLMGVCAGIAAVLITARTTAGSSNLGLGYELDAIAAVVIGGTSLFGGRGTIVGTIIGVLIFSLLNNLFTLNNLDSSTQAVAKGAIIVIAVLLQQRVTRRDTRT